SRPHLSKASSVLVSTSLMMTDPFAATAERFSFTRRPSINASPLRTISSVRPSAVLLWSSFQKFYSVPSVEALQRLTLEPYRTILGYPSLMRSVWNSLLLAVTTATLVMLVTAVICWIVVKTKLRGRWLLDNFASLPMVFPGIVLGLAIMILYLYLPVG